MSTPDDLLAIVALRRCLERRDYAGASKLITLQTTADGLGELASHAWQLRQAEAWIAYRQSVAAWRAEHEETLRRLAEPEPISAEQAAENRRVLREALRESDNYAGDAAASGWPQQRRAAA